MKIKAPLAIYVITHKNFKEKKSYQQAIYSTFNRDIDNYLERGINIPVFFCDSKQIDIDKNSYEKIAVVILIDNAMLLDKDDKKIVQLTKKKKLHIISIALSRNAYKFSSYFAEHNLVRMYDDKQSVSEKIDLLLFELAHDLSKLLLGKKNLKIFLSHAKDGGNDIAINAKCHIETKTKMSSFYDVNDIQNSTQWKKVLKKGVKKSVLLVFQTDKFSTREWCKKEILLAKEYNVPIVVVNALKDGEDRSFPYMANVPIVCLKGDNVDYQSILFQILIESIRHYYEEVFITYFMKLHFPKYQYALLSLAPELLTFVYQQKANNFIYPDPPLGKEELKLFDKTLSVNTPLSYIKKKTKFKKAPYNIAISISKSQDAEAYGLGEIPLRDFIIELTRHLLAHKQSLLYGGDVRYDKSINFAEIIIKLSETYSHTKDPSITNYLAHTLYTKLDNTLKSDLKGVVKLEDVAYDSHNIGIEKSQLPDEIVFSEELSKTRKKMNKDLDVRIVAGGKLDGFSGKYPGILEESYLALKAKKPTFLIGAFGGATTKVIEALEGDKPKEFTLKFQLKNKKFSSLYTQYKVIGKSKQLKYSKMVKYLNSVGIDGLNNGLTKKENLRLFDSKNIYEIVFLILKGIGEL